MGLIVKKNIFFKSILLIFHIFHISFIVFFQGSLYRASRVETVASTVVHPAESEPKCPELAPRSPHSRHPEEVALSGSETFTKSPSGSPE